MTKKQAARPTLSVHFSETPPKTVRWRIVIISTGKALLGLSDSSTICRLSFLSGRTQSAIITKWQSEWPATHFIKDTRAATPTSLRWHKEQNILLVGTPFQHRVWSFLLDIPAGQTRTYGEMAAQIGNPKAARAVGTALGANPVPLIIPCHRVVAINGLGGFTGGLTIKRKLLKSEV